MADTSEGEGLASVSILLYAYSGGRGEIPGDVSYALTRLAEVSDRLVVVHGSAVEPSARAALGALAGQVIAMPEEHFSPRWYRDVWEQVGSSASHDDRVVLTGDSWLGPLFPLPAIERRMAGTAPDLWQMVENANGARESFPEEGFPDAPRPWGWVCLRGAVLRSAEWRNYPLEDGTRPEWRLNTYFSARGWRTGYAFPASDFPSPDPALHHVPLLLEAGCPFVDKAVFQGYPPYLNRHGILGRDVAKAVAAAGYGADLMWESLARTTPPKALNTNAGMLEVIDASSPEPPAATRVAVVARVSEPQAFDVLLAHVGNVPDPFDFYVTTTDGISAGRIERWLESWWPGRAGRYEVRVTPASPGNHMADFFVACRDVLLSDDYDLVIKLHLRKSSRRSMNAARYFRRYQFENLLNDRGHVHGVLRLFADNPRLGVVFPPMIHIGYATMGRGWAGLEAPARRLARQLGISVPLDRVSPLAPYGGMFVARPAALRLLTERSWSFGDYRSAERAGHSLKRIQERLVAAAAAQRGFHVRTVLTPAHAAISHTALDFKVDEMFSTTRGYPVEQIRLLHKAGYTGYGGPAAILRMYLRVNHPRVTELLRPAYRVADFGLRAVRLARMLRAGASGGSRKDQM